MTDRSPVAKADALRAAAAMLADARRITAAIPVTTPPMPIVIDTPLSRVWAKAADRRDRVRQMSLDGKPVAEIAATLGISAGYVVQLRRQIGVGRLR